MQGCDKLLEDIEGLPILRRQALAMLAADLGSVAVTLRAPDPERQAVVQDLDVTTLPVPDASTGMSASLRAAADWAAGHPLFILPADMPDISAADMRTLASAYTGTPLRATSDQGTPGHPVLFSPDLLSELGKLSGDTGARDVLKTHPPKRIKLPRNHATTDLDTPEDWQAYRNSLF